MSDHKTRQESGSSDATATGQPQRNKWSSKFKWLVVTLVATGLLYFAPLLIGWSPLRSTIVGYLTGEFKGNISVAGATWSWFSPVKITGVRAVDEKGEHLLSAKSIECSNSLLTILFSGDTGVISIDAWKANWVLRNDGSNIEDAVANYMTAENDSEPTRMTIKLHSGEMSLSQNDSPVYKIIGVDGTVQVNAVNAPLTLSARGTSESAVHGKGSVDLNAIIGCWNENEANYADGKVELTAKSFDTQVLSPIAKRYLPGMMVSGKLDSKSVVRWENYSECVEINSESLNASHLRFAYEPIFGTDQLDAQSLVAKGNLRINGLNLFASGFTAKTEYANVSVDGELSIDHVLSAIQGEHRLDDDFAISGTIDLSKLTKMMPQTLRIQKTTTIDEGTIQLSAHSRMSGKHRDTVLNAELVGVKARHGQTFVNYQNPVRFAATIKQDEHTTKINDILCHTDFLNVSGNASINKGEVTIESNLADMAEQLNLFVDLGNARFAGVLNGTVQWDTPGTDIDFNTGIKSGDVTLNGQLRLEQFIVSIPGSFEWSEPSLQISMNGKGSIKGNETFAVTAANISLNAGKDQCGIAITAPVDMYKLDSSIPVRATLNGNLKSWQARMSPFVDLSTYKLAGDANIGADLVFDANHIAFNQCNYELEWFEFSNSAVAIQEPRLIGELKGKFDFENSKLEIPDVTLVSSSVSVRGRQIQVSFAESNQATGQAAFRGDLQRIHSWFGQPDDQSIRWSGKVEGNAGLSSTKNGVVGNIRATATELVAASPAKPRTQMVSSNNLSPNGTTVLWSEPKADLVAEFIFETESQGLTFDRLGLASNSLSMEAKGSIKEVTTQLNSNIEGQWHPNWNQLGAIVSETTSGQIKIEGGTARSFRVNGPFIAGTNEKSTNLLPNDFNAAASIAWNRASLFGIVVGATDLNVEYKKNIAQIQPTSIPVGQGQLNVAPRLNLTGDQYVIEHDKGKLIDNVQLSEDVCRGWLKYVTPIVADATSVHGRFSVVNDQIRMPLNDPWKGDLKAGIMIHEATLGPGPLSFQLIEVARIVKAIVNGNPLQSVIGGDNSSRQWVVMPEQTIQVQMKDDRIYHNGVRFLIGDVEIRTKGYVAKDQSLLMTAEIPIRNEWVSGKSWLASLKGRSLSIPISGTVQSPAIDKTVLQQISKDLLKNMAGDALKNQFQDRIDKSLEKGINKFDQELKKGLKDIFGGGR